MLLYHNRVYVLQGYNTNIDMFLKERNIPLDLIERTGLEFSNEVYYVYTKYFMRDSSLIIFGSYSLSESESEIAKLIDVAEIGSFETIESSNTLTYHFVLPGNFGLSFAMQYRLPQSLLDNLGICKIVNSSGFYEFKKINDNRLDFVHVLEGYFSTKYYIYPETKTLIVAIETLSRKVRLDADLERRKPAGAN